MRPNMAHNFSSLFKPSIAGDSGLSLSNNMICADPFTSCSDYNMSWIYGNNKLSSPNSGELPNVSNPPESSFKEADTIHNLLTSMPVPSLFTTAQLHSHSTSADMSATALLQKAASIGVTKSTVQSFPASIDMKCHHGGSTMPDTLLNMNQNMDSNIHIEGLINNGVGFMNGGEDEDVYPVKRRAIARDDLGGQTRDFLGVGGFQTLCQPSINGWI